MKKKEVKEEEVLIYSIIKLNYAIEKVLEQTFNGYHITPDQFFNIKLIMENDNRISIAEIKKRLFKKNTDSSRMVKRLKEKKLIELKPNGEIKREVIGLTKLGKEKYKTGYAKLSNFTRFLKYLPKDTIETTIKNMNQIEKAAEEYLSNQNTERVYSKPQSFEKDF